MAVARSVLLLVALLAVASCRSGGDNAEVFEIPTAVDRVSEHGWTIQTDGDCVLIEGDGLRIPACWPVDVRLPSDVMVLVHSNGNLDDSIGGYLVGTYPGHSTGSPDVAPVVFESSRYPTVEATRLENNYWVAFVNFPLEEVRVGSKRCTPPDSIAGGAYFDC